MHLDKTTAKITISCLLLVLSVSLVLSEDFDNEYMEVEANILSNAKIVSIEVPDYIFFGNLTKGEWSDEMLIKVNNTGNVDVEVTPELVNSSEEIFSYTSFRLQKTSNGTQVPLTRLGAFSFDVEKQDDESFYMSLDLRNYPQDIPEDMMGHKSEIRFVAMPQ